MRIAVMANRKVNPRVESFNLDEKVDLPLYKQPEAQTLYKERVGVDLKGLYKGFRNADKIIINKSDYTQGKTK